MPGDLSFQYVLRSALQFVDQIGFHRKRGVGRPDLVERIPPVLKMLQAPDIGPQIPEMPEHKDTSVLDRIATDQDAGCPVQQGNASGGMSR